MEQLAIVVTTPICMQWLVSAQIMQWDILPACFARACKNYAPDDLVDDDCSKLHVAKHMLLSSVRNSKAAYVWCNATTGAWLLLGQHDIWGRAHLQALPGSSQRQPRPQQHPDSEVVADSRCMPQIRR